MRTIGHHIHQLDLGIANAYLVGGASLTLVDSGASGSVARLERELARVGVRLADLERIVVTHAHFDHAGGLAEVRARSNAEVWAHHLDAPRIRAGREAPGPDRATLSRRDRFVGRIVRGDLPAAPVDRALRGGERLHAVRSDARVVHLPGHSRGQIGLWFEDERLLLGGDVVTRFVPWRLTLPLAAYTQDLPEAIRSIRAVAAMSVETLGVGHGGALVGDAEAFLNRLATRLARLQPRLEAA